MLKKFKKWIKKKENNSSDIILTFKSDKFNNIKIYTTGGGSGGGGINEMENKAEKLTQQDDLIQSLYRVIDNYYQIINSYHEENGQLMIEIQKLKDKLESIDD